MTTTKTSRQNLIECLNKHNITTIIVSDVVGEGWKLSFSTPEGAEVLLMSDYEDDFDNISQDLMNLLGDLAGEYIMLEGIISRDGDSFSFGGDRTCEYTATA